MRVPPHGDRLLGGRVGAAVGVRFGPAGGGAGAALQPPGAAGRAAGQAVAGTLNLSLLPACPNCLQPALISSLVQQVRKCDVRFIIVTDLSSKCTSICPEKTKGNCYML